MDYGPSPTCAYTQLVRVITCKRTSTRDNGLSNQTKLATQTSMLPTPFRPPCTPSRLASHASRSARTTPRSISSLTSSSTSLSKEDDRHAETSHSPSSNPFRGCTRVSLSSCQPAAKASWVSRFGPSTVRTFELLTDLRLSSAA